MQIVDVIASRGVGSSYCTDQRAQRYAAHIDGLFIEGDPVLPGFKAPREVPEAICLQLLLDDGSVANGDGSSGVFPGRAGVDPPVRADEQIQIVEQTIKPLLIGRSLDVFRPLAEELDAVQVNGGRMHMALRWAISAALLDAVAVARRLTKAEVLADEWGTTMATSVPPLLGQSSNDWEYSLDRCIMRRISSFHRSTRNRKAWEDHPGLLEWMKERVQKYAPGFILDVQLDMNGFPGRDYDNDTDKIIAYMAELEAIADPLPIVWATPVEMPDRDSQIAKMVEIRQAMKAKQMKGSLIADYFCASAEDHKLFADAGAADYQMIHAPTIGSVQGCMDVVVYCRERGIKPYLAGSASSTDRTGQVVAHMAAATAPDLLLMTPGGGIDTPHTIAVNEIERVIAIVRARSAAAAR